MSLPGPAEELAGRATFLDRPTRVQLIELWIRHLLEEGGGGSTGLPASMTGLPGAWRRALERVPAILEPWRELTAGRPEAASRVVEEVVRALHAADWTLRKSPENPRNSALALRMDAARQLQPQAFLTQAPELLDQLAAGAAGGEVRFGPLRDVLKKAPRSRWNRPEETVAFKDAVLGAWERSHAEAVAEWEGGMLMEALAQLSQELDKKREAMRRITRLLGVSLEHLGRGADWTSGFWREDLWRVLEDFAERVERDPSIRDLAAMLGRYEEDRRRLEEQRVEEPVTRPRYRSLAGGRSEVKGLHLSDDLERLTASDLSMLADPETELQFYARYLEKRLLTYEMDARELYEDHHLAIRLRLRPVPERHRGPIVLCIDTSGSMAGEPETVAKTICLAVLRVALGERRPCWAISFSSGNDLRELELTRFPASLSELLRFLGGSFHGGTDPGPALDAAMRRIERPEYSRADLLVISDGAFELERGLPARLKAARERMDFRLHVLIVGETPVPDALPMADFRWAWKPGGHFRDGGVQLVKALERDTRPAGEPPQQQALRSPQQSTVDTTARSSRGGRHGSLHNRRRKPMR